MIRVGLTGGYATGKSFVAAELERLGCYVIHADRLGHEVLMPGEEGYAPTVARFGQAVLSSNGTIDRKKLAAIVFTSPHQLAELNAIVHPAVFRKEVSLTTTYFNDHPNGIVVYEAAILIETGRHAQYDRLILTTATEELQVERARERDGSTQEQVLARIRRQLPFSEKRKHADFVIDTSGTKEDTIRQVHQVFAELRKGTKA